MYFYPGGIRRRLFDGQQIGAEQHTVLHQLLFMHGEPVGRLDRQIAGPPQPLRHLPGQFGPAGPLRGVGGLRRHLPVHRHGEEGQQFAVAAPEAIPVLGNQGHQPTHQLQQAIVVLQRLPPGLALVGLLAGP